MLRFTTTACLLLLGNTVANACKMETKTHTSEAPVFAARIQSAHSYVDPALGLVMTEYTVATVECLSGECAPTATVVMIGGEVGDLVTRVAAKSTPKKGSVLVFREHRVGNTVMARPVTSNWSMQ